MNFCVESLIVFVIFIWRLEISEVRIIYKYTVILAFFFVGVAVYRCDFRSGGVGFCVFTKSINKWFRVVFFIIYFVFLKFNLYFRFSEIVIYTFSSFILFFMWFLLEEDIIFWLVFVFFMITNFAGIFLARYFIRVSETFWVFFRGVSLFIVIVIFGAFWVFGFVNVRYGEFGFSFSSGCDVASFYILIFFNSEVERVFRVRFLSFFF